jgi:1-acyl-sn-glycerol-3-phosphate acyltransferase
MTWLRSLAFLLVQALITPLCFFAMLVSLALGRRLLYRLVKGWTATVVFAARVLCGIDYRVIGREHIPDKPVVVLSKHQSPWETFFFLQLFPPQVWLLKRELLRIPFFGWGLAMLAPISIDRRAKFSALKQLVKEGADRLARGLWVVIFPEGTRTRPGERRSYHAGGALLATQTNTPVLPVAVNSGEFWGKDSFLKHPGVITVSIGPLLHPQGYKPDEFNELVKTWIEAEVARIASPERKEGFVPAQHSAAHEAGKSLS